MKYNFVRSNRTEMTFSSVETVRSTGHHKRMFCTYFNNEYVGFLYLHGVKSETA